MRTGITACIVIVILAAVTLIARSSPAEPLVPLVQDRGTTPMPAIVFLTATLETGPTGPGLDMWEGTIPNLLQSIRVIGTVSGLGNPLTILPSTNFPNGLGDADSKRHDRPGCPHNCGDTNGSGGLVDLADFANFAFCFGLDPDFAVECGCSDLNVDGSINLLDFNTFALLFGEPSFNTAPDCLVPPAEPVCITFVNNANEDARVALYASSNPYIHLGNLVDTDNLVLLPVVDQGCIDVDDLVGPFEISPLIQDGQALNYQIECGLIGSFAVSVMQFDATVINPDETTGPFRLGTDFFCGANFVINVTDVDVDGEFEIGP